MIIDCPPHIGPATLAAVGIADMVLIPVTPSGADLVATDSALAMVHDAQAARRDNGPSAETMIPEQRQWSPMFVGAQ